MVQENVYVASKQWNWLITNFDSGSNVTHVIVKQTACNFRVTLRTLKYVMGMASRIWIVSYQWVEDSLAAGSPLPEVRSLLLQRLRVVRYSTSLIHILFLNITLGFYLQLRDTGVPGFCCKCMKYDTGEL